MDQMSGELKGWFAPHNAVRRRRAPGAAAADGIATETCAGV